MMKYSDFEKPRNVNFQSGALLKMIERLLYTKKLRLVRSFLLFNYTYIKI